MRLQFLQAALYSPSKNCTLGIGLDMSAFSYTIFVVQDDGIE